MLLTIAPAQRKQPRGKQNTKTKSPTKHNANKEDKGILANLAWTVFSMTLVGMLLSFLIQLRFAPNAEWGMVALIHNGAIPNSTRQPPPAEKTSPPKRPSIVLPGLNFGTNL